MSIIITVFGQCVPPSYGSFIKSDIGSIACYKTGDIVCDTIRKTRRWETEVKDALSPYMRPDTTFVDVGSNIGWYTFSFAKNYRVVAFEPFIKNIALQNATRCKHPKLAKNIELHEIGLSNTTQTCDLFQQEHVNHGDTHSVCDDAQRAAFFVKGYARLSWSRLYRLDDVASSALFQQHKVMKIDIEGHEYEMMLGATRFFAEGSPPQAVYVEVFQLGPKKRLLIAFLTQRGYILKSSIKAANYLFVLA